MIIFHSIGESVFCMKVLQYKSLQLFAVLYRGISGHKANNSIFNKASYKSAPTSGEEN